MDAVVSWLFKLKVPPQPSPLSSSTSPGLTKGWVVCGEAHVHWHSTSATTPRKAYGMVEEGCRNRVFLTLEIQRMKPKAVIIVWYRGPPMAGGYHTRQHTYRTAPSTQRVLRDRPSPFLCPSPIHK